MLLKEKILVNDIATGTPITVTSRDGTELQAIFAEAKNYIQFYLESDDIYQVADKLRSSKLNLRFFHDGSDQECVAQIIGLSRERGQKNLVELRVTSPIKEVSIRSSVRISHTTNVVVKRNDEDVFEGVSNDISQGGIGVWTDIKLEAKVGDIFVIEFMLTTTFALNAKLVRKQENDVTRAYDYEYGFVFVSNDLSEQEKLVGEILTVKLKMMDAKK